VIYHVHRQGDESDRRQHATANLRGEGGRERHGDAVWTILRPMQALSRESRKTRRRTKRKNEISLHLYFPKARTLLWKCFVYRKSGKSTSMLQNNCMGSFLS
jgi:hypothetical protein